VASNGRQKSESWTIYKRLLGYSKKHWKFMAFATVGIGIEALSAGAFSMLMKPMIDQTFVAKNPEVRWILPLSILGLVLLRGAASWISDYGMARAGKGVVLDLRQQVMAKYLRMPSTLFDQESVPALVSRLNYDAEQVSQASSEAIKNALTDILTILVLLGVMLYVSVKVTVAVLFIAPVMAYIATRVASRYRRINRGIQELSLIHI
jgi:subfamily B ATP-binding cassette protein MsbA